MNVTPAIHLDWSFYATAAIERDAAVQAREQRRADRIGRLTLIGRQALARYVETRAATPAAAAIRREIFRAAIATRRHLRRHFAGAVT